MARAALNPATRARRCRSFGVASVTARRRAQPRAHSPSPPPFRDLDSVSLSFPSKSGVTLVISFSCTLRSAEMPHSQMERLTSQTGKLALNPVARPPSPLTHKRTVTPSYLGGGKASGAPAKADFPTIKAFKEGLAPRPPSPKRKAPVPQLTGARLFDQCLPMNCLPNRTASTQPSRAKDDSGDRPPPAEQLALRSSPSARVVKRPNGQYAHLLELPRSVPYALRMHKGSAMGTVHIIPVLTPAAAQAIREDAERSAQKVGGWAPRAVGCCTNDVLVSQLSAASQQLIFEAFRNVIMPFAVKAFPDARLNVDSLPRSVECFFIIKYKADKSRREFGEHTDHTKITVNLSLTSPGTDFEAGGLYFPCAGKGGLEAAGDEATARGATGDGKVTKSGGVCAGVASALSARRSLASQSKGLLLKAPAGTAIIHHGDIKHAGDRIEAGERLQLVAFFYGNERRGNALPLSAPEAPPSARHATRVPPPKADTKGLLTDVVLKEPQRLLELNDVANMISR